MQERSIRLAGRMATRMGDVYRDPHSMRCLTAPMIRSSRSGASTRQARPARPADTGSTCCRCRYGRGTAPCAVRTTTATSTPQRTFSRRGSASSPTRKVPRGTREPWRLQSPKRSWRGRKTRGDRNGPRRQTSQNRESPGFNYGECQNLKTLSQNLVADNAVDNSQLELADFDRVFPTVGISHDESMSRRYLMFDLDSASLKKEFGPTRYALAYSDLREALENRGFEHRQGSGYLSKAPISKNKLIVLYDSLVEELPWLNTCSTAMHFADIGKTFNLKTLARNSSTSISDVEFFRNQGTQKRTSRASAESKTQSARATGKDNIIQFAPRQNGKDIPSSKGTSLASKSQKYVAMANALNAASKSYVYRNEVAR